MPSAPSITSGSGGASSSLTVPTIPIYNANPINTFKLRLSMANAMTNTGPASKWLFIGTSQFKGTGLANQGTQNITAQLVTIFQRILNSTTAVMPGLVGFDPNDTLTDPRFALGAAGWTWPQTRGLCAVNCLVDAPSAVTNTVFTPGVFNGSIDTFDFFTVGTTLSGVSHTNFTGGATQNNSTTNAGGDIAQKFTISGAAGTANFLTILPAGTFNCFYWGIDPYLAANNNIRIGNGCINGLGNSSNWAKALGGQSLDCIRIYAPTCLFMEIDIDDSAGGFLVTTNQFYNNIQSIISFAQGLGIECYLISSSRPNPTSPFSDLATVAYGQQLIAFSNANNVVMFDVQSRMGPYNGGWGTNGLSLGSVHYNIPGCYDVAQALANGIMSLC